jgi:hypothetical protein
LHEEHPVRVFEATPVVGESLEKAIADARSWLLSTRNEAATEGAALDDEPGNAVASAREVR